MTKAAPPNPSPIGLWTYDLDHIPLIVCMFYQVVVDLVDGHVTRAEALLRVMMRDGRVAGPAELLGYIEAIDAEDFLTRLTVERVCADAARLAARGSAVPLCINLGPRQLTAALPELLDAARATHGLPRAAIAIEVVESPALGPESRCTLEVLAGRGYRLVRDDVGAGAADLLALAQVPFGGLKVDRAIVSRAVAGEARASAVLRMLASLGRELGASVVAEGVEDRARATPVLWLAGVREAQGFGIRRPMPIESLGDELVLGADGRVYLAGEVRDA